MNLRQQRAVDPAPALAGRKGGLVLPNEIAQSLTDGLLLLTPGGRVSQANAAATSLLMGTGIDPDDLVGRDGIEVFDRTLGADGRSLAVDENPVRTCLTTGHLVDHKLVGVPQREGAVLWLGVRVTPIRLRPSAASAEVGAGLIDGFVVVIRRSGADEATVAALRDRDHQLSVAQRMARLSMWRWDPDSGRVEWLDGAARGSGTSGERRGLADYLDGVHPDDRPSHDAMLGSLLAGAASAEIDLRYRWQDGWRHWHLWAESVVDQQGRVTALWGTTQDVTERREAEAAVRRLSMTDSLTELANRAQVLEQITTGLVERPLGLEVGLVLLDIDRFSQVNARLGPSTGDLLLIEVGRRLGRLAGSHRTPGRLGADQFALVLARTSTDEVRELTERAFAELSHPYLLEGVGEPVTVTFSAGGVTSERSLPHSTSELVRQCEIAVSFAQAGGGAQVAMFDDELRSQVLGRLDMEGRLRTALGNGSVFPLYQPVVTLGSDVEGDVVTSCEALARMDDGGLLIAPSEFVGVAEENGLIVDLDLAVFNKAVHQVLVSPPAPGFGLAVNVSPLSLQVPGLVDQMAAALRDVGLDGRSLRIEITESCLAEPTPVLLANLRGLRELGAKIGLDDFGTGYSALAYLSRFDLDFIKVDRSFVDGICADGRSRAVVQAVIDLAHAHELVVVAEGIETAGQLEALRDMRCDLVQGFYLGRPMTIESLSALTANALFPEGPSK